jgi:hypothetical protein
MNAIVVFIFCHINRVISDQTCHSQSIYTRRNKKEGHRSTFIIAYIASQLYSVCHVPAKVMLKSSLLKVRLIGFNNSPQQGLSLAKMFSDKNW